MGGELTGVDPAAMWSGAALDSRKIRGAELFFALRGAETDGHRFVRQALDSGAAAAVVDRLPEAAPGQGLIRVPDTFEGLHALTRAMREELGCKIVGITGSVGKTTCKELLAKMMGRRHNVAASPGNLNNLYGFPLALLGVPDGIEWMVAEMGMSQPGELAGVSRLGRPEVAVFTNVRPVHLEFFGTVRAIAEAKAGLLAGLVPNGLVIANADDPEVEWIVERHDGPIVRYSVQQPADVTADRIEPLPEGRSGYRFRLRARDESQIVELPLHGIYNVENCLAAAACAWSLGVPLDEIASAAGEAQPAPMRGEVHRLPGGITIIDDSYNSSPEALRSALGSAARLPARRRWAVLGEMLELGPTGPERHREVGQEIDGADFDEIVGVGELAAELVAGARDAGVKTRYFGTASEAAEAASSSLRAGDLVLVKGSRGVALEQVVAALLVQGGEI